MDKFFRFSDYDIWAYLSSGMLLIAAWDFAFGTNWALKADWSAADGVIVIFAAYIVGHIVATPSSWILERLIVGRLLRSPSVNLFSDQQTGFRWLLQKTVLGNYYSPLPPDLRNRVLKKAGPDVMPGEAVFWRAYAIVKRDPTASPRMETFLNLYGFCRNISFVAFLAGSFNATAAYQAARMNITEVLANELYIWMLVSIIGGLLMFHRFLKFYRLYAVEVFVTYVETEGRSNAG